MSFKFVLSLLVLPAVMNEQAITTLCTSNNVANIPGAVAPSSGNGKCHCHSLKPTTRGYCFGSNSGIHQPNEYFCLCGSTTPAHGNNNVIDCCLKLTCGGNLQTSCAMANHYWDSAKSSTVFTTPQIDCCSQRANCHGYACTTGYTLKTNPSTIYCTTDSTSCTLLRCCEAKALCSSYTCPSYYTLKSDAGTTYCNTNLVSCSSALCCRRMTCGDNPPMPCASANDYWDTMKAALIYTTASIDCCTLKANCGGYSCGAGYISKSSPSSTYCSSNSISCTTSRCCDTQATCGGYACSGNHGYILKSNAPAVYCPTNAASCTNSMCCDKTCLGYGGCHSGYTLKASAAAIYCSKNSNSASACNTQNCCNHDNTCGTITQHTCSMPHHYWDTAKAATVFSVPHIDCCSQQANCNGYQCPPSYTKTTNAATTYCTSNLASCSMLTCCTSMTTCGGISAQLCASPNHYWDTSKAATVYTTLNIDCCSPQEQCTMYVCPSGYMSKSTASAVFCPTNLASCTTALCCDTIHTGTFTTCGSIGFMTCASPSTMYWDVAKAGTVFTTPNVDCCTAKANCAWYICPSGYTLTASAAQTHCTSDASSCNTMTCCVATGGTSPSIGIICSGHACSAGYTLKPTAATIFCGTATSSTCSTMTCCDAIICSGHTCPSGYTLKSNAATLACGTSTCSTGTCCNVITCSGHACPSGYTLKNNAATISCGSSTCSTASCCNGNAATATCTGHACPTGYSLKSNPATISCGSSTSSTCSTATCCNANPATTSCSVQTCPTGYTLKTNAASISCGSATSSPCDTATCCTAFCNGHTCPTGYTLKNAAASISCGTASSSTCSTATCCDVSTCNGYACWPSVWYSPLPNAATISCSPCTTATCCHTQVQGSFGFNAVGLTVPQVNAAAKETLSITFNVPTFAVSLTATSSRRLKRSARKTLRRLAGNWFTQYSCKLPQSKVQSAQDKIVQLSSDSSTFTATFKNNLLQVGASGSAIAYVNVSNFNGKFAAPITTTTTTTQAATTKAVVVSPVRASLGVANVLGSVSLLTGLSLLAL